MREASNVRGIVYVVDAANLSPALDEQTDQGLRDAAEYLHDVLLVLQKRLTQAKTSKAPPAMPVLVASNKSELFTALPAPLVKKVLEDQIGQVRESRSKGLLDSGVDADDSDGALGEDKDWLGHGGTDRFNFRQTEEFNVSVDVLAGSITATDGPEVDSWWQWIANRL